MARACTFAISLGILLITGCGTGTIDGQDPGDPTDPTDPNDPNNPDDTDDPNNPPDDPPDNTLPTYPTQHPRIYLGTQRARLEAALAANTPAATRFVAKVDQWVAGTDLWGFQAWNAALLGQLTGQAKYCN